MTETMPTVGGTAATVTHAAASAGSVAYVGTADSPRTDESVLARAAETGDVPLVLTDAGPDHPIVWVNAAFTRLTGYALDEVVGLNARLLQGPGTDPDAVARIEAALAAGRSVVELVLNYRKDGTAFWNRMSINPVPDADGRTTHFLGAQIDVTDQVVSERVHSHQLDVALHTAARLDLLAGVADALARRLGDDAAAAVAETVVPALAGWAFVAVPDERGRLARVHVTAADPQLAIEARLLQDGRLTWIETWPGILSALAGVDGGAPMPRPADPQRLTARATPEQAAALRRLGLGATLVVPLRARGRVLGVLVLVQAEADGFGPEAVVTAAHLGPRAGLALDNVRLFLSQRDAALTLQRRLLPQVAPVPGLDVSVAYLPSSRVAEVGGDWYDVFALTDGGLGLAVGDVVGHDLAAAASMGQLASLLRAHAWSGGAPSLVLGRLDELVDGLGMADAATCVYLRWRPRADGGATVTYSRAGHPPPLVRLPDGTVIDLDGGGGTPVGLVQPKPGGRPDAEVTLPAGSLLVAYTDGLVERRDRGLREGIAALRGELRRLPLDADAEAVRDRLVTHLAGHRPEDDVCLLVARPA